jgi:hypothetical protein
LPDDLAFSSQRPRALGLPLGESTDPNRDTWVAKIVEDKSIVAGKAVGFFASLAFLNTSAQRAFAAAPMRLNSGTGASDDHGDVLLTGIAVSIDATSNTIVTDVSGVKFVNLFLGLYGSFGIRFTTHFKDTLKGTTASSDCAGTTFKVIQVDPTVSTDVDEGDLAVAGIASLGVSLVPPFTVAEVGWIVSLFGSPASPTTGAVGAGFIANLPHTQAVPLSLGGKIVSSYLESTSKRLGSSLEGFWDRRRALRAFESPAQPPPPCSRREGVLIHCTRRTQLRCAICVGTRTGSFRCNGRRSNPRQL